ncbi:MAG: biotin--[acetyl-CoA-carboxylase] ligase [Coriobacteriia bacterium]|nr:biotin--[acetyl-CoA-carboxylase] ligase [Coriobacteriia bacterium]
MLTLSTRAAVASALTSAGERGISGETIAASLGISRVAVGKHVAALRALGYRIASASRTGYRLELAPDVCLPEEVGPRLADPFWVACQGAAELGSTNDEAKRLARAGAPEGTAVVAAHQTGGRGRFDREWASPAGGAYVSCILRPPLPPAAVAPLSLVVALGAARGLATLGIEAGIKWPNDLEVAGRKLAGILVELAAEADRVEWVVVGCGVNVSAPAHERGARVCEQLPEARVAEVAARVLDGIAGAYREFLESGFDALAQEYAARATLTGLTVTVRDATGAVVAEGMVAGIGPDGALLLDRAGTVTAIHAGEVTLRD